MRNGHILNQVFNVGGKKNINGRVGKCEMQTLQTVRTEVRGEVIERVDCGTAHAALRAALEEKSSELVKAALVTTGLGAPPLLPQLRATAAAGEARALQDVAVVISPMEWH